MTTELKDISVLQLQHFVTLTYNLSCLFIVAYEYDIFWCHIAVAIVVVHIVVEN